MNRRVIDLAAVRTERAKAEKRASDFAATRPPKSQVKEPQPTDPPAVHP